MKMDSKEEDLKNMLSSLRGYFMMLYQGYFGIEDYEPARVIFESNT